MKVFLGKILHNKLEAVLKQTIRKGRITVVQPDGRVLSVGDDTLGAVTMRIRSWETVSRLVIHPDLAFGEAFMDGDITLESGTIYDLLAIVFQNVGTGDIPGPSWITRAAVRTLQALGSTNDPARSKENVAHHYDPPRQAV